MALNNLIQNKEELKIEIQNLQKILKSKEKQLKKIEYKIRTSCKHEWIELPRIDVPFERSNYKCLKCESIHITPSG
jgi:predicted SprT family Zn-dependent metalloprotease